MSLTWFITGASRGLGRELTERALARGDRVAATLRSPGRLDDLAAAYAGRLWVHCLDVTDTPALREVVDAAFRELGRIDVVVSNAGFGVLGAAEEVTDAQIDAIVATNLTASIQLARAVTPHLRAQGGGRIQQMSSMGGLVGFPGFSMYHVTKWGLEGFYEAFSQEVEAFGIRTTCIEPGVVRTGFYHGAPLAPALEAYTDDVAAWRREIDVNDLPGSSSKVVAAMLDAADADSPPRRLLLGSDAYQVVRGALIDRLAAIEAQKAIAFSTDLDG